jgi:hypothetical protein
MNSAEMSIRRLPRLSDIRKSKQTFAAKDINVCYADKAAIQVADAKVSFVCSATNEMRIALEKRMKV